MAPGTWTEPGIVTLVTAASSRQQPHGAPSTDPAGHPARQKGMDEPHGPVSTSELTAGSKPLKYSEVGCSQTKEELAFHYPTSVQVPRIQPESIKSHPEISPGGPCAPQTHPKCKPSCSWEQAALLRHKVAFPPARNSYQLWHLNVVR